MSGILKKWIRGKVRQSLATMAENPVRLAQSQRVQLMKFLTYEKPVFAEVSDMETFMCCEFTQECVEAYQNEFGKRFTQIKGAYLTLKNIELRIYEAESFSVSVRLVVPQIQFLGGEGEAIVGHPVFFTEHQEIRMLLRSPQHGIYRFLWPRLSVEKAGEGMMIQEIIGIDEMIQESMSFRKQKFGTTKMNRRIPVSIDDTKKRGFLLAHTNEDERHKSGKKRQRALHPGWRGFSEITYKDCIISDEQLKILKRDDCKHALVLRVSLYKKLAWYPPIDMFQQDVFASDKTATPISKTYQKMTYSPNCSNNLNSSPESVFSWEESPVLNKSSTSIIETKSSGEKPIFYMEKKEFFSDNDTLPPSSSPVTYNP
ncbi:hypothetical protein PMAC_002497 [Pneumocystis sp. 'macacae']|nr:hypothetical protein PMAC_002497 [Pneumocystis sp. 'macacae']